MELTPAQQHVVDHDAGRLRVRGGFGTGKTTALVHRYLRLAGAGPVLVLCRSRDAAIRFRDAVLPHLHGAVDGLAITTFHGLAFEVLRRNRVERRLLRGAEQWALVQRMLSAERAELW